MIRGSCLRWRKYWSGKYTLCTFHKVYIIIHTLTYIISQIKCHTLILFDSYPSITYARLSILVLLLTLSNLGTSFAAAYLAKDTTVNDKEELVSSDTKTALSTQATAAKFGVEPLPEEEQHAARRLDCITTDNNDRFDNEGENEILCETEAGGYGYSILEVGTRENGSCGTIQTQCERGHYVDIYRIFSNEERVTINICGPNTRVTENAAKGLVSFTAPGVAKINMSYTDYGCKFDGQDLTQRTGEVCDTGSDCARKHKCYQPSEATVVRCRSDCESRFRKNSDQRVCNDSCFNTNTCELINDVLMLAGETYHPTFTPTTTPKPTGSPTTTGPTTKSPTSRPTISSAPSKSPQPSMSPSMSSVPTLTPCPEQYTVTKTYNTGDEVTCGGKNKSPSDANCQSSNDDTGLVWYYSGKKWKKIGTCTKNGFVNFSVFG